MLSLSVNLLTFPGQGESSKLLTSSSAHIFAINLQWVFLNQWQMENDCKNYSMINVLERYVAKMRSGPSCSQHR